MIKPTQFTFRHGLNIVIFSGLVNSTCALYAAEPGSDSTAQAVEFEDLIVTAQKIPQRLQDVPVSITAIGGDLLRQGDIANINQLESIAPNVTLNVGAHSAEVRIRGFGTSGGNTGFEPAVGTVIDGVFYGRSEFLSALFFDVDQIEIIRGPQSTLYGKNTSAGVINLTTATGDADGDSHFDILKSENREIRIRPALNMALSDNLTARLAAVYWTNSGYLYNTTAQQDTGNVNMRALRGKLRWQPNATNELDFAAFYIARKNRPTYGQSFNTRPELLALMRQYDPQVETDPLDDRVHQNVHSLLKHYTQGANAQWRHQLPWTGPFRNIEITSVSAWARNNSPVRIVDPDHSPIPALKGSNLGIARYAQWTQEIRFSAKNDALSLIGGVFGIGSDTATSDLLEVEDYPAAFAYVSAANADSELPGGANTGFYGQLAGELAPLFAPINEGYSTFNPETAEINFSQQAKAWSVFGQLEWQYTSWGTMTFGLRVGQENKSGRFSSQGEGFFIPTILGQQNHNSERSRDESELSPRIAFSFKPWEKTKTYVSWSRGFKSGGFNGLPYTPQNLEFEPEQTDNYEIGLKSHLFNRTLTLNTAVFHTNFENLQLSEFDGVRFAIRNAAQARAQGFEVEMAWLPGTPGTGIRLAIGHANTQFIRYPDAPAQANSGESTQDLSGRVLVRAPKWTVGLLPSISLPWTGQDFGINLATDLLYKSGHYTDADLDPLSYQRGTLRVNARITIAALDERWQLALIGRNLSDQAVLNGFSDQPGASGSYIGFQRGKGRHLAAELRINF